MEEALSEVINLCRYVALHHLVVEMPGCDGRNDGSTLTLSTLI